MTREEAEKEIRDNFTKVWADGIIKALEQQSEDAISRESVMLRIREFIGNPTYTELMMVNDVKSLPPVQPIYNTSEWCHDCKEYNKDKHCCPRFNRVIRNAVEEIKQPKTGHWIEYTRVLIPEPINRWEQAWYCSECGYGNQECEDGSARPEWKCCPCCGARMIEPQAESEE